MKAEQITCDNMIFVQTDEKLDATRLMENFTEI